MSCRTSYRMFYRFRLRLAAGMLILSASLPSRAESRPEDAQLLARYPAQDSLAPAADDRPDARRCLGELTWSPDRFEVTWTGADRSDRKTLVHFPSPVPSGDPANDRVTMEWYRPFSPAPTPRPAVLIVHESGSRMPVGRLFARAFQAEGLDALLIYLPYYGSRRDNRDRPQAEQLLTVMRQAVADVRRGRDAIAALPEIDGREITVQGTSLGGFVVATAAGLDRGFQGVHVVLAGGNLYEVITSGEQDAAQLRRELQQAGLSDKALRELLWTVEPMRLAHRLDPQRTWLYSAEQDRVVPLAQAEALARAAGLDSEHHIRVAGDHYSAIVHLPTIVRQIAARIQETAASRSASSGL